MTNTLEIDPSFDRLSDALAERSARSALETALPAYLREQRWFGGKVRDITSVRIERWVDLQGEDDACLCLARVEDSDGRKTEHQLYLASRADRGTWEVSDALQSGSTRRRLAEILATGDVLEGQGMRLIVDRAHEAVCPGDGRVLGADQSNTSLVFDDACLLKVYRRLERGPSPDVELSRFLSEEAGFTAVPRFIATMTAEFEGASVDLLALQAWVENDGDAFGWARAACLAALEANPDSLKRWLESEPTAVERATGLGRTTAQLHAALASATGPGLAPSLPGEDDLTDWLGTLCEEASALLPLLEEGTPLHAAVAWIDSADIKLPDDTGLKTRIHGDYHLGQVLLTGDSFVVVDFEGEPSRSLRERRTLQSPLADVAGMVRSWDYAARLTARESSGSAVEGLANEWARTMRNRFLDAYWREASRAEPAFLPAAEKDRDALLTLLELRKALYEVRYELNNRPDWLDIPGAAVIRLVEALSNV